MFKLVSSLKCSCKSNSDMKLFKFLCRFNEDDDDMASSEWWLRCVSRRFVCQQTCLSHGSDSVMKLTWRPWWLAKPEIKSTAAYWLVYTMLAVDGWLSGFHGHLFFHGFKCFYWLAYTTMGFMDHFYVVKSFQGFITNCEHQFRSRGALLFLRKFQMFMSVHNYHFRVREHFCAFKFLFRVYEW